MFGFLSFCLGCDRSATCSPAVFICQKWIFPHYCKTKVSVNHEINYWEGVSFEGLGTDGTKEYSHTKMEFHQHQSFGEYSSLAVNIVSISFQGNVSMRVSMAEAALFRADVPKWKGHLSNYFDAKSARGLCHLRLIAAASLRSKDVPDATTRDRDGGCVFALVFLLRLEDKT